jgi:hypothetical protein
MAISANMPVSPDYMEKLRRVLRPGVDPDQKDPQTIVSGVTAAAKDNHSQIK